VQIYFVALIYYFVHILNEISLNVNNKATWQNCKWTCSQNHFRVQFNSAQFSSHLIVSVQ